MWLKSFGIINLFLMTVEDDGLKLSKKFLNTVEKNLTKKGIMLMPVISISNHKLLIKILKKKFKTKLLITKEWPAPKI
jgi:hypothetical protein